MRTLATQKGLRFDWLAGRQTRQNQIQIRGRENEKQNELLSCSQHCGQRHWRDHTCSHHERFCSNLPLPSQLPMSS